jgi:K+-transporting ATPase ATPase C chain
MSRENSKELETKLAEPTPSHGFVMDMLTHVRVSIIATIVTVVIVSGVYPAIVWGLAQAIFNHQANGSLVKKDGSATTDDKDAVGSSLLGQPFTDARYFHPRPSAANNGAGSSYSPAGGYDPTASGGTNYGPLSDELINGLTLSPTPPATQPAESLQYDGIRLRTIHYAVDNNIAFKLFTLRSDGTGAKTEVPLIKFEDSQGNLNDIALVDAFPHPPTDTPDRMVVFADNFNTPIPADAVTASASGLDPHISPANAQLQAARVASKRNVSVEQVKALIEKCTDGPDLGFLGDPGVNVLRLNLALDAKYPIPAPPPAPVTQPATQPATTQPAK